MERRKGVGREVRGLLGITELYLGTSVVSLSLVIVTLMMPMILMMTRVMKTVIIVSLTLDLNSSRALLLSHLTPHLFSQF